MAVVRLGRCAAFNPGKHGPDDWRVEFNRGAATHPELVFMLGMVLIAEDRYKLPGERGRYQLWYFIDRLLCAKTPQQVVAVAEDTQSTLETTWQR